MSASMQESGQPPMSRAMIATVFKLRRLWLVVCAALMLMPSAAGAHPHVWVTVKASLVYDGEGRVNAVRHAWDFDEAYSAFTVQGLDKNNDGKFTPEELGELAKVNVESLVDFDYFTVVRANGAKQGFAAPTEYGLSHDGKTLRLTFVLPLQRPAASRTIGFEVYDPTFFVAFDLAKEDDAVTLSGAPQGCALNVSRPKNLPMQTLAESVFDALAPGANFGIQFANKAIVACP